MNKLLREVPSMESWIEGANTTFVPVTLDTHFVRRHLDQLKEFIEKWLQEPMDFANEISMHGFNFYAITIRTYYDY